LIPRRCPPAAVSSLTMSLDNFDFDTLARHMNQNSPYHYIPSQHVAILFLVLFSVSSLAHMGQLVYYRMWWLIPTVCLCGLLEIIGWSARLWSSISPVLFSPYEMQITATILGPTPLLAANFVILGRIVKILGPEYSRISPKWYTILFCSFDVVALVIQGVGGGKAAGAVGNGRDPTPGGNIMLGGICFQLFTITIFSLFGSEFFFRYFSKKPVHPVSPSETELGKLQRTPMNSRVMFMTCALAFNTTCIFIRAVYRTIELSDGWNGRIISTQVLFNVLDGGMVTLAMYTLNIAHPGFLLKNASPPSRDRSLSPKAESD